MLGSEATQGDKEMKYIKAFFGWFIGTLLITGVASALVPPFPFLASYSDPHGATRSIITLIVSIGMGIWVRRLLKSGVFGD